MNLCQTNNNASLKKQILIRVEDNFYKLKI